MWPDQVLQTPISMLELGDLLWAGGALLVSALGLLMAYFVVVVPIVALVKAGPDKRRMSIAFTCGGCSSASALIPR